MTIKIGLIGCGGIAEPHVNGYLKIAEQAKIVAVCDVVTANAQRRSEQAGGAEIFSDYNDMLANSDIQAVDICLPHHLHKDAIVAAARAGKHILCEKPLCLSVEEGNEVKAAVKEHNITLMCAHNQLYMPPVKRAKELIELGVLGKVYEIRTTDSFYNNFDPANMGWRANRAFSGGGELIDTGYHPTYLLLHLAGSKPTEVTAMLSTHRLHFMDGEDSAQVLVRFADGSVGSLVTSWAYEAAAITEKFSIVAEKGSLYSYGSDLFYKLHNQQPEKIELAGVDTFAAEIADFIACLNQQRRPLNTEIEGIDVLKVILGAYQSVKEKRTIVLNEMQ